MLTSLKAPLCVRYDLLGEADVVPDNTLDMGCWQAAAVCQQSSVCLRLCLESVFDVDGRSNNFMC
jgi:hypothetical protein